MHARGFCTGLGLQGLSHGPQSGCRHQVRGADLTLRELRELPAACSLGFLIFFWRRRRCIISRRSFATRPEFRDPAQSICGSEPQSETEGQCQPVGASALEILPYFGLYVFLLKQTWLWVKNMYPKWNPGKWKHGLEFVVWWFDFDPTCVSEVINHLIRSSGRDAEAAAARGLARLRQVLLLRGGGRARPCGHAAMRPVTGQLGAVPRLQRALGAKGLEIYFLTTHSLSLSLSLSFSISLSLFFCLPAEGNYNCLAMEFLGKSLEDHVQMRPGRGLNARGRAEKGGAFLRI